MDNSFFCITCDSSAGGPRRAVTDVMRRITAAYHYAIRRIKQTENSIFNERFHEAITNNKSRDLWAEVKRIRGCEASSTKEIDVRYTFDEISSYFASKC